MSKQISCTVSDEVYAEVEDIRKREKRSVSAAASILLENAVKERIRQREKNTKKGQK
jgi:hypothetical protein